MTHEMYEWAMMIILSLIFILTLATCWVEYKKAHRDEE